MKHLSQKVRKNGRKKIGRGSNKNNETENKHEIEEKQSENLLFGIREDTERKV